MKNYEVGYEWNCGNHRTVLAEYDFDLKSFEVYNSKDEKLGTVYPACIEDMEDAIKQLDEGECPICDSWEDGLNHVCSDEKF